MTDHGRFISINVVASLLAALPIGGQESSKKPAPVRIGIAKAEQAGKLPPLTTEIGKRAALAFTKGEWKTARGLYEDILAEAPENPLALANLGAVTFQMKDYDAARDYLERAIKHNPELVSARVTLGMVYFYGGEFYRSIAELSNALQRDPTDARGHNYLAVVLRDQGWIDGAETELQRAIESNPQYTEAHYNLARMYMERKPPSIELARRHYYKAIELGAEPDRNIEGKLSVASD